MEDEQGCPDVEFEGVKIPQCNVDAGVGEALYLCKHESVKGLDCEGLRIQFENEEISAEQIMETVKSATNNSSIRYNIDVIRKLIKEEPLE